MIINPLYRGRGYVYFIENIEERTVKIGVSKNPRERISALRTANSSPLAFLKIIPTNEMERDETELHRRFDRYRLQGEWFQLCSEILEYAGEARPLNTLYDYEQMDSYSIITGLARWIAKFRFPLYMFEYLRSAIDICEKAAIRRAKEND